MDKIKKILADDAVFYGTLITLVGLTAFGFGRYSVAETGFGSQASAEIVLTEEPFTSKLPATTSSESVVASKNGSKYHYSWCPGASQIKDENKVFFDSVAKARASGYEPAANCEGLE